MGEKTFVSGQSFRKSARNFFANKVWAKKAPLGFKVAFVSEHEGMNGVKGRVGTFFTLFILPKVGRGFFSLIVFCSCRAAKSETQAPHRNQRPPKEARREWSLGSEKKKERKKSSFFSGAGKNKVGRHGTFCASWTSFSGVVGPLPHFGGSCGAGGSWRIPAVFLGIRMVRAVYYLFFTC
ncbi:uncharacterized protein TM35_000064430 [Trypanosoma theileri]|uniref:Uncharacterized protein n=1 Tax=Trypanosoma theileri TaxID=67003 RepID=A0A1X0P3P8_9TRYP|nr:uncharacterized protein TM35_000064430 [Trypanosoma theileri]ORC91438.1 hypothetical protein TM35_000064430 [Trypanosoma theileri]